MKLSFLAAAAQVTAGGAASLSVLKPTQLVQQRLRTSAKKGDEATALVAVDGVDTPHTITSAHTHFGDTRCPCIGFDHIDGETIVSYEDGGQASYPADLGASCKDWDDGVHPDCGDAKKAPWCRQAWCLVDACNCKLPVPPKPSAYVPDARFQGRPLYYSYETCGGVDMWTREKPKLGVPGCRCVGFTGMPGTTEVKLKADGRNSQEVVEYPAELGGQCSVWDDGMHPDCRGADRPDWCTKRWCYVDPCACGLEQPPKVTTYLASATFTGKSLYYSYEACGEKDTFTATENPGACVNQDSLEKCVALKVPGGRRKCAWAGERCMGAELVSHPLCTGLQEKQQPGVKSHGKAAAWGKWSLLVASMLAMVSGSL